MVWLDGWLASLRKLRISSPLCRSTRRWRESSTHVSRHPKGDKPVEMDYDMVLGLERGKEKEFHSKKKKLFSHPFSSSRFHPVSLGTSFHQAPHNRICLLLFSFDISLCRGLYKKSYCRSNSINWCDWRNWRDKSLWTKQSKWSSRMTMARRSKGGMFWYVSRGRWDVND